MFPDCDRHVLGASRQVCAALREMQTRDVAAVTCGQNGTIVREVGCFLERNDISAFHVQGERGTSSTLREV